jgi:hypothetical protein
MSKVTVGYRYFMGLHFGLAYGPVDTVLSIKVGDRVIWQGNITTSTAVALSASTDIFGGEDREGGIFGTLDVMMGEATQGANAYLAARQGGQQPGYRGLLTAVFRGLDETLVPGLPFSFRRWYQQSGGYVGCNNPYIKPWAFRVRRILQGWRTAVFHPTKATIQVGNASSINFSDNCNTIAPYALDAGGVAGIIYSTGDYITSFLGGANPQTAMRRTLPQPIIPSLITFRVRLTGAGTYGDALRICFEAIDTGLYYMFFPRIEAFFGAGTSFVGQLNRIGYVAGSSNQIANNTWYRVEITFGQDPIGPGTTQGAICRVYTESTNELFGLAFWSGQNPVPINKIVFQRDGDPAPFVAEYDNVTITGSPVLAGMNPAHIIYQCLTDPEWGMGYPTASIDTASFTAAADTLFAENFGLCMQWTRQTSIEDFVQIVCNHIGAVVATDRRTGLFVLKLIRGGYSVPALPHFNEDNILALDSFQRSAPSESINEITVKYKDPNSNKDAAVTVQNLASINSQGGVVSKTTSYPGLPNQNLAARVAQRDLQASTGNLAKVRFRTNRDAYSLLPGDVIRLSWAKLGLVDLPMRVGRVDYGTLTEGAITVEALEDVFGLPAQTYVAVPGDGWEEPSTAPQPTIDQALIEAPYRTIYRNSTEAERAVLAATDCYAVGFAARPDDGLPAGFNFQTRTGSAEYEDRETDAAFAPYGLLQAGISHTATSITLTAATARELGSLSVGSGALIGTEIVEVTSVDGTTRVIGIKRGCADTVPQAHSAGAAFFAMDDWEGQDSNKYAPSETVDGRFVTVGGGGVLDGTLANVESVTMTQRQHRPYPPGKLRINTFAYPPDTTGDVVATWVHRDRVLQQDDLVDTEFASIGPEAGTTYNIRIYNNVTNTLISQATGLAGLTHTFAAALIPGNLTLRLELESERGGLVSHQKHAYVFNSLNGNPTILAESGDRLVTEDGDNITIEG